MTAPQTMARLLLAEPQSLIRRTVASVARELQLAQVCEAASLETAESMMGSQSFDALCVAVEEDGRALALLRALRAGRCRSHRAIPVVVLVESVGAETLQLLKALEVSRIVIKPFKVKTILESIATLLPRAGVATSRAAAT